ncbi:MFS transporter [Actinoplanes sp. NPDC051851]|uniref:MFS transporter n=1 Tax=Actinoplanes sp. NPDC051851 TaxID=3154753 RepID=UPI003415D329
MNSLWRNREFNLLWAGQALSDLGSTVATLAAPLLVLAITGSAVQAGLVGTVGLIVQLICRLPAGVLTDRVDRRRALRACDAVRVVAYAILTAAVATGNAGLALIIAVVAVDGACVTLFDTTERAALRSIVPAPQLPDAIARNEARVYGASLAGPPLGGLLFGLGHAWPFLGNTVSFLASLAGVSMIRKPLQEKRVEPAAGHAAALAEGIRFVLTEPFLRAVLLIAAPLNFAINGAIFAIILNLQRHGTPPGVIGLTETIVSAGGLAGAVAAPAIQRRLPLARLVQLLCWTTPVVLALSAALAESLAAAVPVAIAVAVGPAINAALFGYQAAITPDHLQGRVVSVVFVAAKSVAVSAPLVAGLLVTAWGGSPTLLFFAASVLISAGTATAGAGIRTMKALEATA